MNKEKRRVPKLRFPGFTEDWEQRKLGEVVKSYSGGTPTASNKEYYGGDIPFIRSAEINSDTTELYITQKGLDNSSAKIVEKGTILYAMYGATSGEVGISKINGAINQAILAMIPLEYNGKIIAQYLRKNKESIIGKYLQGGQGNLSANIILELPIQLPGLEESNQIANFLESFDNIITLHQRKLEHLNLKKKAFLQKLFPKNGERYPELRFPGFTDAWEQRKLEDICSYQSSSLTINDIDENGQYDLYDANSLIGKTNKGYMEIEYITIIKDGAGVGRTRMLPKNTMFLGTMGALTPKNSSLGFLYQLVTSANLGKICTGSTIPHIYFKDYGKLKFYIPSIIEQEVIGKFFNNIDYLVTLHQRKLEHLQLQKKALLQQMFI